MTGVAGGIALFVAFAGVAAIIFALVCWAERGNKTW